MQGEAVGVIGEIGEIHRSITCVLHKIGAPFRCPEIRALPLRGRVYVARHNLVAAGLHRVRVKCNHLVVQVSGLHGGALFRGKFAWQEGYAAFSYSRSQLDDVYQYIQNQQEHHKKRTFREEYVDFLEKFAVEYDARYLFDFFDDLKADNT